MSLSNLSLPSRFVIVTAAPLVVLCVLMVGCSTYDRSLIWASVILCVVLPCWAWAGALILKRIAAAAASNILIAVLWFGAVLLADRVGLMEFGIHQPGPIILMLLPGAMLTLIAIVTLVRSFLGD
jgi:hypothetical protein